MIAVDDNDNRCDLDSAKTAPEKIVANWFWVDLVLNSKRSEHVYQLRACFDKFLESFLREICGLDSCLWILPPMLRNGQFADLLRLFFVVRAKGGYNVVSKNGLWELVAVECGLDLNLVASVKLVYSKYLDALERWLERLVHDKESISNSNDSGFNVGGFLMESGSAFKGLISEAPERIGSSERMFVDLNVSAVVEPSGSEKFVAEDEESIHIDLNKSDVDFLDVGKSGENVEKCVMMGGSSSNGDVVKNVDEDLMSDLRKSEKACNDDDVWSAVVGIDDDDGKVEELDLTTFKKSLPSRKRKQESICRMLNWVTGIARNPSDPAVGSLPEVLKWKSYGSEEFWKQVLLAREALFLKRNVSTSTAEGSTRQVSVSH